VPFLYDGNLILDAGMSNKEARSRTASCYHGWVALFGHPVSFPTPRLHRPSHNASMEQQEQRVLSIRLPVILGQPRRHAVSDQALRLLLFSYRNSGSAFQLGHPQAHLPRDCPWSIIWVSIEALHWFVVMPAAHFWNLPASTIVPFDVVRCQLGQFCSISGPATRIMNGNGSCSSHMLAELTVEASVTRTRRPMKEGGIVREFLRIGRRQRRRYKTRNANPEFLPTLAASALTRHQHPRVSPPPAARRVGM
jgi:hypothetical protein